MSNALAQIYNTLLHESVIGCVKKNFDFSNEEAVEYCGNIISAIRSAPERVAQKLMQCTPQSFAAAARKAADLKLKIDHNQHGYLIPRGNTACFDVAWRGYVYAVKRHIPSLEVQLGLVSEGDEFFVSIKDGQSSYEHIPANPFSGAKEIVGAYAFMEYMAPGQVKTYSKIETMGIEEINHIRSKARDDSIWASWTSEMIKKTVLRRALKLHFASIVSNIEAHDNESYDLKKEPVVSAAQRLTSRFIKPQEQLEVQTNESLAEKTESDDSETIENGEVWEEQKADD